MRLPRVYPILDTTLLDRLGLPLLDAAEALAEGGAQIIQLRHKSDYTREFYLAAKKLAELLKQANIALIINDRCDIAAMLDADGVHLGQDDLPPSAARQLVKAIGFSTHNRSQLKAAANEPVDYLALGPIFATKSKENPDPVVGLEELRRLRTLTAKPLVAIGGIRIEKAQDVWGAGADSIALISDLFPSASRTASKTAVRSRFEEWVAIATTA